MRLATSFVNTVESHGSLDIPERWRIRLISCGILAALLYVSMTLFVGLLWDGYSVVSDVPSELSAIGAPHGSCGRGSARSTLS